MAKIPEFSDAEPDASSELAAYSLRMEQFKLLRGAADGTLPKNIHKDSGLFSFEILEELRDAGLLKAGRHAALVNPCFYDIKITLPGREFLTKLEQPKPDHATQPADGNPPSDEKKVNQWHERWLGKLALEVTAGVLVVAALAAIANCTGML